MGERRVAVAVLLGGTMDLQTHIVIRNLSERNEAW